MSPLGRLYVGLVRAWVEVLVIAYLLGLFVVNEITPGFLASSVLLAYRGLHALVATAGTLSLRQSARERVNRGRTHDNRS